MAHYDGFGDVMDNHMQLQVTYLSDARSGKPYHLDYIGESGPKMQETWNAVGKRVGVTPKILHNRGPYPRRFEVDKLSAKTVQKVCTFVALDLCCLNFELPPACRAALPPGGVDDVGRVRCRRNAEGFIEPVVIGRRGGGRA